MLYLFEKFKNEELKIIIIIYNILSIENLIYIKEKNKLKS